MRKGWSDFLRVRLSLLLAAVLVLSLLPLSALAEGEDTPATPAGWPTTSWAEAEGVENQNFQEKATTSLTSYELPIVNEATGAVTYETVTVDKTKGLGTKENPIAISTPEELILFGQLGSGNTEGKYYILTEQEYNMGGRYMTPLFPEAPHYSGMKGKVFWGTLIGNNARITNAKIQTFETSEQEFNGGLFGGSGGSIFDLTLENATIALYEDCTAGGMVGDMGNLDSRGRLVNCHVKDLSFHGSGKTLGGLVGDSHYYELLTSCTAQVTGNISASRYAGGLVGQNEAEITDCKATVTGSISASGTSSADAGGLVGDNDDATITNCTTEVTGDITASTTEGESTATAGGLVGYSSGAITGCTTEVTGDITASTTGDSSFATAHAGGLVGMMSTNWSGDGAITGCEATVKGSLAASAADQTEAKAYTGGLTGYAWGGVNIADNKAAVQTGVKGPLGAVGKTEAAYDEPHDKPTITDTNSTTLALGSGGVSVTLKGEDKAASVTEDDNGKLTMTFDNTYQNEVVVTRKDGKTVTVPAGTADLVVSSDGTITYGGTTRYPVTFNSQGGSPVTGVYVDKGGTFAKPSDPTRDGFTFTGWYRDEACTTLWNFEQDTVTSALTLYAGWEKIPEPEPEPEPSWEVVPIPTYRPDVEPTEGGTVGTSPANPIAGSRVNITPKPEDGYEVGEVIVTDSRGNRVEVTDNGDGTYSFIQPSGKVTIRVVFSGVKDCDRGPSCPAFGFQDLNMQAWYHDGIHYCVAHGLMTGTGAGAFSPHQTTSRGMVVTILYRLAGSPDMEDELWGYPYADVDVNAYYGTAVYWARLCGVAGGYGDSFGPNDPITREQLAAMLYRFAGSPAAPDLALGFPDAGQVSGYAQDAMRWAVSAGIIEGRENGDLDPRGNATRSEAATMLMRFCENIK